MHRLLALRTRDLYSIAVMLSLARSRYTLAAQSVFLTVNAVGVVFSMVYNANTPDLYPGNAHHKLGWTLTWIACAQALVGLLGSAAGALHSRTYRAKALGERHSFIPVSSEAMAEQQRLYRLSDDSGQGTERNSESLRGNSVSTSGDDAVDATKEFEVDNEQDDDDDSEADLPPLPRGGRFYSLLRKAAGVLSSRAWKFIAFGYSLVDRTILILGFTTFSLGIATYGRFFVSLYAGRGVRKPCRKLTEDLRRRASKSSLAWRIGSKAVSSSGWVFSLLGDGPEASASWDGFVALLSRFRRIAGVLTRS